MEAAVVGAVLSATLPWLRDKAVQKVSQKWRRVLKYDVESIIREFQYINKVIDQYRMASREEDMGGLRMIWIQHLRNLAYEIEDCADNYKMKNIDDKYLAEEISKLKERAEEIPIQLKRYESQWPTRHQRVPSSSSFVQGQLDTAAGPSEGGVGVGVGMEEASRELKALLGESQDQKLRVIFIVGFGGMGKTFLADHVYREEGHRFRRKAFVPAAGKHPDTVLEEILKELQLKEVEQVGNNALEETPTTFNQQQESRRILRFLYYCIQLFTALVLYCKNMLGKLSLHASANNSVDIQQGETNGNQDDDANVLTTPLESSLGTERYLVVIDDARSQELVRDVISGLVQTEQVDSRIIITTTDHKVAGHILGPIHRRHVYKMRPLEEENSEELFRKVAFRGRSSPASDGHMSETFGRDESSSLVIRQYCDGVPLAVISLAKYSAGDHEKCEEAWRKLCNNEEDGRLARMQRVLDDNFNSLALSGPCSLQDCLLYFCMFPSGHDIRRGPLIRRWQAEGLALKQGRNGIIPSADVPVQNLRTLIDRNILWPRQTSLDNQVKTCKPPGLMLGYITSRSKSENFLNLSCGDGHGMDNPNKDIRRLSLYFTGDSESLRVLSKDDLPRLRTLAVFDEGELEHPLSFAKCNLLRVLDLEACPRRLGRRDEWSEICMLKLLKYLSLGVGIDRIPGRIRQLKHLETLQVSKSSVVTVPADVLTLPCLKHLLGKLKLRVSSRNPKKIPDILKHKCKLEKLAGFVTDDDKTKGFGFPVLMRHMNMLRKVKVWYDSTASEDNIKNLSMSINMFLLKAKSMPRIPHALSVDFHECTKEPFQDSLNASGSRLSSLKLRGMLPKIPVFVTELAGVAELCLSSTSLNWQVIVDGVSSLAGLSYLKLDADTKIEGAIVIDVAQFESLNRLCLVAEEIESQIEIKPNALKSLVSLHLIIPGLDRHSAKQIRQLGVLEDVALHCGVDQIIWKEAARGHPNRPNVMFINSP